MQIPNGLCGTDTVDPNQIYLQLGLKERTCQFQYFWDPKGSALGNKIVVAEDLIQQRTEKKYLFLKREQKNQKAHFFLRLDGPFPLFAET